MSNISKTLLENVVKPQGENMIKYNAQSKFCVTCRFWDGIRHVSKDQKFIQVENKNTEGECFGHCKPFMKKAIDKCPGWEKHSLLLGESISEILLSMDEILGKPSQSTGHKNVLNVDSEKKE